MSRLAAVFILLTACAAWSYEDDSWKAPLEAKERAIEAGIRLRHNIMGLYPSMVQIPRDGGGIDVTTTNPFADIQHAVCWTANYLAGLSYKYACLKANGADAETLRDARERADEVFEAVYRCQRVTGVRGLQARGYFLGRGETYAEREDSSKLPFWRQGEADGQTFRWVGDPSHHNYSDAIHGLGQYYTLAAEGEQKDRACEAIDALAGYWVDNDLNIAKYDRSLPEVPILGLTDGKTLNTRVMMAIAGAKIAHHATGKDKYETVYNRLIDQYGVRGLESFRTGKGFDDAEHVFCHLDLLFRIEDDPELLAAYRKVADGLWANHKDDAQSLFTYIHFAIAPDAEGREKALAEALKSLKTFPTDMTLKPRMNSLDPEAKPPYPVHRAAWDNEYLWKGNLLRADGWLSRAVNDVAVSPEDPMVIYAVGAEGGIYQSRDGAATWENWIPVGENLPSPARAIDTGRRTRILAAACDDGFYLSTTAGARWKRLPVPEDGGRPVDIQFAYGNFNVLYAITTRGAYRSRDFGEEYIGGSWETLSENAPPAANPRFVLAQGNPAQLYLLDGRTVFTRELDGGEWERAGEFGLGEYAETYDWFLPDPSNPKRVTAGIRSDYGGMGPLSILQVSGDAGRTWSNDFRSILETLSEKGMAGLASLAVRMELNQLVIDPDDPDLRLASSGNGVAVSRDGGETWTESGEGLEIPVIHHLFAPMHTDWLFVSTPGGLYLSEDGAETWRDGNLWLQFEGNERRELGGAAFIDAYWRARYHGFIDSETARSPAKG